jgi:hypothetical protein
MCSRRARTCVSVKAERQRWLASVHEVEKIRLRQSAFGLAWLGQLGPAMNRFVHRIIMAVLLAAALAIIWNVLGGR